TSVTSASTSVPATMRAIRYHTLGGPEVLQLEEVPTPAPQAGEALVKVAAAGINYADTARRNGRYLERTPLPYIPGSEVAGTVVALGPDTPAEGLAQIGARVMALCSAGGYAEYIALPARALAPIPTGLDWASAAALPVQGLTAYHILHTSGRMQPGETVLINAAAGGVGTLAVQLAKLGGAGKVIAAAGSPEKLELARSLGADETINYVADDLAEQVRALTGGKGADVILEAAGGQIFNRSVASLAMFGRLVTYGQASGESGTLEPARLMTRNASLIGFWLAVLPGRMIQQGMQALMGYLAEGKLRVVVGATYPLAEAARAQAYLTSRGATGKLILLME
ncbi:MAG TPA: NADPH:quinone oxidoreductase family protein, partial [Ktedonobacterales bacterium]|nr:NADPH:quinone oxidoreductase family protein [Ktedonobacterales bacterium]